MILMFLKSINFCIFSASEKIIQNLFNAESSFIQILQIFKAHSSFSNQILYTIPKFPLSNYTRYFVYIFSCGIILIYFQDCSYNNQGFFINLVFILHSSYSVLLSCIIELSLKFFFYSLLFKRLSCNFLSIWSYSSTEFLFTFIFLFNIKFIKSGILFFYLEDTYVQLICNCQHYYCKKFSSN
ncbi:hypothetical protein IMG5_146220 [Ichthyophthirius multifiliis]|uniref:Transmembrane protein n=1 Tax=Ichthyophthirius multifiliis TaxID=5932 RepID=G0QY03_ICHMU|nr:hypothetical protein IMG5_146220 [Ichthyophthirius multifiliis]EGR29903.1 hypothetical protein IMG5_146220 [Ichthyophthirius multifiliis]|eukprot:XP_004031139.1 hypothetical protein IMG5_146220 [Ichthyophthirius multifiliis]